ncbi:MAG: hypothetical protein Q9165_004907 [Trypethelium subeluteriae]
MTQSKEETDVDIALTQRKSDVDIAPIFGDVVFVVGKGHDQTNLRVSSWLLKSASKVFAAMFGPHFAEGQKLSGSNLITVPLPDDDPFAMSILCSELHLRTDMVPDKFNISEIYEIARLIDKYDCHIALKRLFQVWFMENKGTTSPTDLALQMVCASLFSDATAFTNITHELVMRYGEPYINLWDDGVSSFVPWKALGMLEAERSWLRSQIDAILLNYMRSECSVDHGCTYSLYWLGHCMEHIFLGTYDSQWTYNPPCSRAIEKLRASDIPEVDHVVIHSCRCGDDADEHELPDFNLLSLSDKLSRLSHKGLCLDCVRTSGNVKAGHCREESGAHMPRP